MSQYIYINNALRFRIDDAPFPHANGVFAELQEKVSVLFLSRWVSKDSRILTISDAAAVSGTIPSIINNYDGTVTEIWSEDQFNLKDRLLQIARQYVDEIVSQSHHHAAAI
jgi:hypothetical protein